MGRFEGRAPQREKAPQPDQAAEAELRQVQEQIEALSQDLTNAEALAAAEARERVLQNKLNGDSIFDGDGRMTEHGIEG